MKESITIPKIKGEEDVLVEEGIKDHFEITENKDVANLEEMIRGGIKTIMKLLLTEKVDTSFKSEYEYYEYLNAEFNRLVVDKIISGNVNEIVNVGKIALEDFAGMSKTMNKIDINDPGDTVLVVEAINLAAKIVDDRFYMLKPAMIIASACSGAQIGIESDGYNWDIYYLFNKKVGVASFHDPNEEVKSLAVRMGIEISQWEFGWSGITRQELAFDLIAQKETFFAQKMRYKTLPGVNAERKRELFLEIEKRYSIKNFLDKKDEKYKISDIVS